MSKEPTVSAIVLNWNGVHHLAECLPSLAAQSYRNLELLVVDNGSTENSRDITCAHNARWVRLDTNVSLARALNLGVQAASGDVVLLLNNDMRFDRELIRHMVGELVRDPKIFAVDAKQLDWDGTRAVHQATFLADTDQDTGAVADEIVPGLYLTQRPATEPCDVAMGSGANLMVRREMFENLGGLDERMQMGLEDVDLCWRAWLENWRTVFVPSAICWHRVGASSVTAQGRRSRLRGTLAGRVLFATKLLPARYVLAAWSATVGGTLRDFAIPGGEDKFAGERVRVIGEVLGYLPALLAERRLVFQRARTTPTAQLARMLDLGSARVGY